MSRLLNGTLTVFHQPEGHSHVIQDWSENIHSTWTDTHLSPLLSVFPLPLRLVRHPCSPTQRLSQLGPVTVAVPAAFSAYVPMLFALPSLLSDNVSDTSHHETLGMAHITGSRADRADRASCLCVCRRAIMRGDLYIPGFSSFLGQISRTTRSAVIISCPIFSRYLTGTAVLEAAVITFELDSKWWNRRATVFYYWSTVKMAKVNNMAECRISAEVVSLLQP